MKELLYKEIKNKAELFRTRNGLGTTDTVCLESFLLKKNIITLFKPLPDQIAGMAVKATNERSFILINSQHVKGRQNFTIAHELYHVCIQDKFESQHCNTGLFDKQRDSEEKKADIFAACFLMPENGVMELIPDKEKSVKNQVTTETLFKIQHYYGVSFNALLFRLIELGLIDKSYYSKYDSGKKCLAIRHGYDVSLYEPANENKIIGDYVTKATLLYEKKLISESEYLRLLNTVNIDPYRKLEETDE